MWISGQSIVKNWSVLPEELLEAFESGALPPWNRIADKPMNKDEFMSLMCDPFDTALYCFDRERLLALIQKAFYKEEEAREFFSYTGNTNNFCYPEIKSKADAEACQILLLKVDGATWREIAQALWPNDKYEPENYLHKRIQRGLKRGKELLNSLLPSKK